MSSKKQYLFKVIRISDFIKIPQYVKQVQQEYREFGTNKGYAPLQPFAWTFLPVYETTQNALVLKPMHM